MLLQGNLVYTLQCYNVVCFNTHDLKKTGYFSSFISCRVAIQLMGPGRWLRVKVLAVPVEDLSLESPPACAHRAGSGQGLSLILVLLNQDGC